MRYLLIGVFGLGSLAWADDLGDRFKQLQTTYKSLTCDEVGPANEPAGLACRETGIVSFKVFFAEVEDFIEQAFQRKLVNHDKQNDYQQELRSLLIKSHVAWLASRTADVALALSKFDPRSLDHRRGTLRLASELSASRSSFYTNPNLVGRKKTKPVMKKSLAPTSDGPLIPTPVALTDATLTMHDRLFAEVDKCIIKDNRSIDECSVPYLAGTEAMMQIATDEIRRKATVEGWTKDRLNLFISAQDNWKKSRDADAAYQSMIAIQEEVDGVNRYYRAMLNGRRVTALEYLLEWREE